MKNLNSLIRSKKTVFRIKEFQSLLKINTNAGLKSFLYRAKKSETLYNPYKGIRTLPHYDKFELADKVRKNSYISLETVLYKEGLIFQYYENTITCVSNDTRNYFIDNKDIRFSKIKDSILNNSIGIKQYDNYRIATAERALCDMIYILPKGNIENIKGLNLVRLQEILKIYPKKTRLYINKLLNVE